MAPEAPPKRPPDRRFDAFARDIQELRREAFASLGQEDLDHLYKMERWGRAATLLGLATAWAGPNPVSVAGLAMGRSARWLLMHHIGHRGYDNVPGVPPRYTSEVFAAGRRRFLDWPDWIEPEAWKYEHNVLHHAFTGEETDPDLVERNTAWLHGFPKAARYAILALLAATWRESYYVQGTLAARLEKETGREPTRRELGQRALLECWLPYAGYAFVGLPLLFAPLGPLAVGSAALNSLLADFVTNMHSFLVVGPNHSGDDLHRFDDRPASKGEYFARQVLGSTNYTTGGDLTDFSQMWLNYQIEHHLFPDLPMLQYRKLQPKVRALCEKHGLPYVQESVWRRFAKMAEIFVGKKTMKRGASYAGRASPDVMATSAPRAG